MRRIDGPHVRRGRRKIIFKADLIAATDEAAYLEAFTSHGGTRTWDRFSLPCKGMLDLLNSSATVNLLSNSELTNAHSCYRRAGLVSQACTRPFLSEKMLDTITPGVHNCFVAYP